MMMMLTTQLAFTPSVVTTLTGKQALQNTTGSDAPYPAISLAETGSATTTDSFELNPSVSTAAPQARSGAFHMSGVLFLLLAGAAGFLVAQEPFRNMVGDVFRKLTGGKHKEEEPSRYADDASEKLPSPKVAPATSRHRKVVATPKKESVTV
jgi:hypothetical protein